MLCKVEKLEWGFKFVSKTLIPIYKRFSLWKYKRLPGIQLVSFPLFRQYVTRRRTLQMISRYLGLPYHLYYIDIAGLSKINRIYGFDAGDRIIEDVEQVLSQLPHIWYDKWGMYSDDFLLCSKRPDFIETIRAAMPTDVHIVVLPTIAYRSAAWMLYILSVTKYTFDTKGYR